MKKVGSGKARKSVRQTLRNGRGEQIVATCAFGKISHRDDSSVFLEHEVLTPAMREQIEAFYGKVDADLFESEHQAHMKLCRDLAEAARKRGEEDKARRIELKARVWAEKHCKAFFADLGKGVTR